MKLGHFWATLCHSPLFVMRHGFGMLAHTFRGSTLRWVLGLESDRRVFERYRDIRRTEREYLPSVTLDIADMPRDGSPSQANTLDRRSTTDRPQCEA
jgi:hypothetical protein